MLYRYVRRTSCKKFIDLYGNHSHDKMKKLVCDFRFYTECLGMKVLRKRDMTEERYTNAFLGYGPEDAHFAIELSYSESLTSLLTFLMITEICFL